MLAIAFLSLCGSLEKFQIMRTVFQGKENKVLRVSCQRPSLLCSSTMDGVITLSSILKQTLKIRTQARLKNTCAEWIKIAQRIQNKSVQGIIEITNMDSFTQETRSRHQRMGYSQSLTYQMHVYFLLLCSLLHSKELRQACKCRLLSITLLECWKCETWIQKCRGTFWKLSQKPDIL